MHANGHAEAEQGTLAILIDGDNAQPALLKEMLAEASKYGRITIRRIYGDWTAPTMNGWKGSLQEYAIQPVQQFANTGKKNATDSAMIIDAMDLLYSGSVTGFCLASSDSDYTRLASRLRESGKFVMGIGNRQTAKAFTNACERFVFLDNLAPAPEASSNGTNGKSNEQPSAKVPLKEALPLLKQAFRFQVQDDGYASLSSIGSALRSLDPSFDHRTFGCSNLRALVSGFPDHFELREETTPGGYPVLFMRNKGGSV